MKHLEDYLGPLLKRMGGNALWFFGALFVLVVGGAALGALVGGGYNIDNGWPMAIGFMVGMVLFLALFALTAHYNRRPALSAEELIATLDISGPATAELLETSTGLIVAQLELVVQAIIARYPDMPQELALELGQVVPGLRREVADILGDLRDGRLVS